MPVHEPPRGQVRERQRLRLHHVATHQRALLRHRRHDHRRPVAGVPETERRRAGGPRGERSAGVVEEREGKDVFSVVHVLEPSAQGVGAFPRVLAVRVADVHERIHERVGAQSLVARKERDADAMLGEQLHASSGRARCESTPLIRGEDAGARHDALEQRQGVVFVRVVHRADREHEQRVLEGAARGRRVHRVSPPFGGRVARHVGVDLGVDRGRHHAEGRAGATRARRGMCLRWNDRRRCVRGGAACGARVRRDDKK